jgi:hypothetical protein
MYYYVVDHNRAIHESKIQCNIEYEWIIILMLLDKENCYEKKYVQLLFHKYLSFIVIIYLSQLPRNKLL